MATLVCLMLCSCVCVSRATVPERSPDLNPVKFKRRPNAPPVVLVENGKPRATIVCANKELRLAASELQTHIELATGAKLPIVDAKKEGTGVFLGDEAVARANGILVANLPPEGFEIKTIPDGIIIAGNALWGVYEFLERFVGVRWYYPGDLGMSVPKKDNLIIKPVWLADARCSANERTGRATSRADQSCTVVCGKESVGRTASPATPRSSGTNTTPRNSIFSNCAATAHGK